MSMDTDKVEAMKAKVKMQISPLTMVKALLMFVGGMAMNALLLGIIVMLLWGWLVPAVFPKVPVIQHVTYWQGWGIAFLCSILFKK